MVILGYQVGYPWLAIIGYPWLSLVIHGYPWLSSGYPWLSVGYHGYRWLCHGYDVGYPSVGLSMLFTWTSTVT